jgi:cytochrome c oxidase subunit 2
MSAQWRSMAFCAGLCPVIASCSGVQSALDPAGEEAKSVATLFWAMTIGGLIIWAIVVAISQYAARWKRGTISEKAAGQVILLGGVVFPIVVLTALLVYALWLMPFLRPFAKSGEASTRIEVVGNQFWWHVVYRRADGSKVVSANEIRLPVGERVEFSLTSSDMIHSFWIPALGGKMDLIPGRINRLSLLAQRKGTYRGQCAEFCGTSHAFMAFPAVVMEPVEFEAWLEQRSVPAATDPTNAGQAVFFREKCGECHSVAGTAAKGSAGPDLSHVGSRLTLAAGRMENSETNMARFIADPGSIKPGSQMPGYQNLSEEDLSAVVKWLKGLQ